MTIPLCNGEIQCHLGFCTFHHRAGSLGKMNQEMEGDVTFQERLGSSEDTFTQLVILSAVFLEAGLPCLLPSLLGGTVYCSECRTLVRSCSWLFPEGIII